MSLELKVDFALELIEKSLKQRVKPFIACSFGKDSMVVLDLVRRVNKDVPVVFCNTRCEFPETILFKNMIVKEWDLEYIELLPYKNMTWRKCADKYGLPCMRIPGTKRHAPRCCYYLKEKPAEVFYTSTQADLVFTGLRAYESRNRRLFTIRMDKNKKLVDGTWTCAHYYYMKTYSLWKANPIIKWTKKEVWDYIHSRGLPINEVYLKWDGLYDRCGCLLCTAYKGWEKKLQVSHPKIYKFILETFIKS